MLKLACLHSRRLLLDQAKAKQTEILLFLLDPRLLRNVCQRLCDEKLDYANEILSKSHLRFILPQTILSVNYLE